MPRGRLTRAGSFDHVGITVADLDTVTAFFVGLGLEVEGRTFVEGEFLDTVIGIPDSRAEIVMLRPPDRGTRLELSSFVRPDHEPGSPAAMSNDLGLRNVAFEVDDLQAVVDRLAADGYGLVGGIGEYEHIWRMASLHARTGGDHRVPGRAHRLTRARSERDQPDVKRCPCFPT
jgi:catechol 2,3-dioxygenase-like lactoylglutathione lyase family enzyme